MDTLLIVVLTYLGIGVSLLVAAIIADLWQGNGTPLQDMKTVEDTANTIMIMLVFIVGWWWFVGCFVKDHVYGNGGKG